MNEPLEIDIVYGLSSLVINLNREEQLLEPFCLKDGQKTSKVLSSSQSLEKSRSLLATTMVQSVQWPVSYLHQCQYLLLKTRSTATGRYSKKTIVWFNNTAVYIRTFSNMNEGLGKVLRFGAYDSSVLERLNWMRSELAPVLQKTLKATGPIDLKFIWAQVII